MPMTNIADFALLKSWIKNFKSEQGRDPFFEDFPDDIGDLARPFTRLSIAVFHEA